MTAGPRSTPVPNRVAAADVAATAVSATDTQKAALAIGTGASRAPPVVLERAGFPPAVTAISNAPPLADGRCRPGAGREQTGPGPTIPSVQRAAGPRQCRTSRRPRALRHCPLVSPCGG